MKNYQLEVHHEDDHIYEMEIDDNQTVPESRTENKEKPRSERDKYHPKLFRFTICIVFVAFLGVSTYLVYRDIQKTDILKYNSAYMLNLSKHYQEIKVLENHIATLELLTVQTGDCSDIKSRIPVATDDIYHIRLSMDSFPVFCDMSTAGGGWTVIQHRFDGSVDFYRDYNAYQNGFGNLNGEFWLGNDKIHAITSKGNYKLRIDLEDFYGKIGYAEYATFSVGDEQSQYILHVDNYSGNISDDLTYHNNMKFSTKDKDHDLWDYNCAAKEKKGGWWYNACADVNLNGLYYNPITDQFSTSHWKDISYKYKSTPYWLHWQRYVAMKKTRMMVKRL